MEPTCIVWFYKVLHNMTKSKKRNSSSFVLGRHDHHYHDYHNIMNEIRSIKHTAFSIPPLTTPPTKMYQNLRCFMHSFYKIPCLCIHSKSCSLVFLHSFRNLFLYIKNVICFLFSGFRFSSRSRCTKHKFLSLLTYFGCIWKWTLLF